VIDSQKQTQGLRAAQLLRPSLRSGIRALHEHGDLRTSRIWFDRAYLEAQQDGRTEEMALAALGLGGVWLHEHRSAAQAAIVRGRQQDALGRVAPGSSLALRLRARLAGEEDYRRGEHATIMAELDAILRSADPVVRAEALNIAHHCVLGPDHGRRRLALAQHLLGESALTGRRGDLMLALLWQTVDLFLIADPHAERRLSELRMLLDEQDHRAVGYVARAIDVMLTLRAGDLDRVERLAEECAQVGTAAGDDDTQGWYGGQLVALRWYQGRVAELLPILVDLVHSPTLSAVDNSYFSALAISAAAAGDHRLAASAVARLGPDLPRSSSWLVSMYGLVEAAHALGDQDAAARAFGELRPYADLPMIASLGVACFGSVRHALGVASLAVGELDRGIEHLREAVHHNLAIGHWPAATLSRWRLARALARRGEPGDTHLAGEEAAVATRDAKRMGMVLGEPRGPAITVAAEKPEPVTFRRHGRRWRVVQGDTSVTVEHSVGMVHLAILAANPGHEIPATDLATGTGLPSVVSATASAMSAQPVLDDVARQEYRQRLAVLEDRIDDLSRTDRAAADQLLVEREWLLAELAAAAGMGHRARTFTGGDERARVAVGKAIRRALGRIAEADAELGAYLRSTVQTGMRCTYTP
jgi:hypothetical protein